ncbi:nucleotidyltransferase [Pontibacter cellulosilyticus]|uniref:Nucleotidyltransferase n=1 Tax=Pontibacter cellulosilyticus TaxID=1720253 RepID=A0A923N2W6_9BACT|nr:nucleotidyltransferase [Pontibacter cellulosilyticus]MBC5991236.1 nucleotidyltransferase [Pontibacter cellulosilyticus]
MAKVIELQEGLHQQKAHDFYREALGILAESKIDFLVGGGFALRLYTDIMRDTKDLDVFCRSGDCPKMLKVFKEQGYETELTDARWLAKAKSGENFMDIIFNNPGNHCAVDDTWFEKSVKSELLDIKVRVIPAETLIWSKLYVQNRERYDGADINHIILRYGKKLDWKWLWSHMETHWQLVLQQFMSFMFVYPSERDLIPKWLYDELLVRAKDQYEMPAPVEKICRGPLIDQTQYATDITDWEYKVVTIRSV